MKARGRADSCLHASPNLRPRGCSVRSRRDRDTLVHACPSTVGTTSRTAAKLSGVLAIERVPRRTKTTRTAPQRSAQLIAERFRTVERGSSRLPRLLALSIAPTTSGTAAKSDLRVPPPLRRTRPDPGARRSPGKDRTRSGEELVQNGSWPLGHAGRRVDGSRSPRPYASGTNTAWSLPRTAHRTPSAAFHSEPSSNSGSPRLRLKDRCRPDWRGRRHWCLSLDVRRLLPSTPRRPAGADPRALRYPSDTRRLSASAPATGSCLPERLVSGKTGVVLVPQSDDDYCGFLPFAVSSAARGYRALTLSFGTRLLGSEESEPAPRPRRFGRTAELRRKE